MSFMQMLMNSIFGQSAAATGASGGERAARRARGSGFTRVLISLAVAIVFGAVYFYFRLPALNIHSGELYWFIFWLCAVYAACMLLLRGSASKPAGGKASFLRKNVPVPFFIVCALLLVAIVGGISGWVVFRARAYSELLKTETGDFTQDVAEISWDQIPMLDEDSANNLANRKLGELSDLVSQFTVSTSSSQINYNGRPVRVTYLNYGGVFKWWNNRNEGIPAYMIVDMVTQEVSVVRVDNGMRYSPSEYFGRDLDRALRFKYPTKIFSDVNFEIADDGTPYWIASVITKRIGLFGGEDVVGAVLMNAVTGECEYCDVADVPKWVDRVYVASLLIGQYNYYGKYHNGFWNSLFGQTDCTATTTGYNYIALDDDVWMYTGVTSVTGDRGNIGFILVNQRTKDSRYYSCAGAEEYSAMSSAEGAVQQYSYISTFPLLLNISDEPTYFMALKDTAGLVKMYAMVNVQQYQIVATGSSVISCQKSYHELLAENGIVDSSDIPADEPEPEIELETASGVIDDIRSAAIDGNTYFFIKLAGGEAYYSISAKEDVNAVILSKGDSVTVSYDKANAGGQMIPAVKLEK